MNFQRILEAVKIIQRSTKRYLSSMRLQEECNVILKCILYQQKNSLTKTFQRRTLSQKDNAPLNFPTSFVAAAIFFTRQNKAKQQVAI